MATWRDRPAPISDAQIKETYEADVVIAGLGYAGTAALRSCAEAGTEVIGIEMMDRNRYQCFGRDIGHINSRFLKSRGIPEVDPLELFNEMMRRAGNRANPALVMKFAQNCGPAFDWFTDMYGVDGLNDVHTAFWPDGGAQFKAIPDCTLNGYHFWYGTAQFPEPRGWPGSPSLNDVVRANQDLAEQAGARLFFETTAVQPVVESGQVRGVIGRKRDGGYIRFLARRGVILAAGDFSGNREMMKDLVTDIRDLLPEGQEYPPCLGRKGMGIQIGVWAGGRLEPRPLPVMGGNYVTVPGFTTFGILWLDRRGKRFCNETFGGPELSGFAANQMPPGTYYNVFDEHVLHDLQWAVPAHGGFDEADPATLKNLKAIMQNADQHPKGAPDSMRPITGGMKFPYHAETIYSGRTPEELAENAGLSGAVARQLAASIRRYNELCRKGRDEDFGKDPKLLRPLSGRLYLQASELRGSLGLTLVTVGGFVTDETQNVLDADYEPIPGLYATGNCCGRRFGAQYTTPIAGLSISMALTLGREAGLAAAGQTEP